ncbi:glutamate mutase L [candidate division WOR-3 bacterium]|nr:glutamate mutase L [candidate division WOR-3 bacterium]
MKLEKEKYILVTDVGSTTTKAVLIVNQKGKLHILGGYNVPTTVEKPAEDVKIGVGESARKLQATTKVQILNKDGHIAIPYLTTSSAGGGLQILVFGLSSTETGRVAQMTAYGAGGVILKTLTVDDQIRAVDKMRLIRQLHPDMVLMAGGLDGGAIAGVVRLAELLTLADPEPKFRQKEKIPLVFCGNVDARQFVRKTLQDVFDVHVVDNVRPDTLNLNTGPAKGKVHELFMENVMERAPGYAELKKWTVSDIIPTPAGVENILRLYGDKIGKNVMMVDIGGATTDIFSNIAGDYHRTVAANIGMSYSISNVLAQAGIEKITRHLPRSFTEREIRDYIANKTLNPTWVPETDAENLTEQAVAIEGINVAWNQHLDMNFKIVRLGLLDKKKLIEEYNKFEDTFFLTTKKYFQLSDIDLIIGSGGVLSFAKSSEEAIWMLTEGFKPSGITKLALDSSFRSPHLGVLAEVDPESALKLFLDECLREIGYVVAPTGRIQPKKKVLNVKNLTDDQNHTLCGGDFLYLPEGGNLEITLGKHVCLSCNGDTSKLETKLPVLFDCRGREGRTIKQARMLDTPLSKSGIEAFSPKVKEFRSNIRPSRPEIKKGAFEIERRLPYEGQIFVARRQTVKSDDVIGENRFAPPRLYIIDLNRIAGYSRPLTEAEVTQGLLVNVGDNVDLGQAIFRVKPEGGFKIPFNYLSQVRARVSKIEPQGLVILREIQDYDGKPHTVKAAKALRVNPKHIRTYLKVKEGDFVDADRILAQRLSSGVPAIVKSPSTGTVKEIDTEKGTVTVQYDITPVPLKAFVQGEVVRVKPNYAAWVKTKGATLYGIIGFGGEASGKITLLKDTRDLDPSKKGKVIVTERSIDEEFLRRAAEAQVSGIIAPSIHNSDWVAYYGQELGVALTGDEQLPFTLILTEGFGEFEMNDEYRKFLLKMHGKQASLSGRTQIRAGVTRPMVIVSD